MTIILIFIGCSFVSLICAVATEKSIFRVVSGLFLAAAVIFFACLVGIFY